ncbi:hypothetical protein ASPZODRAFT_169878 [Penicilliopsis zonata CBS 506.65]|uniref:Mitochondrial division protein 1 n=1 Tax=Penicilliopsis zonata CBS 506.65 TaxID=1073090 RepID=A0A1L9S6L9_9EURO|nr:hypothetical protein ASPZODRAFT_169878 [Penicilliopsis zonata CBS 506.65]OJJ42821.1 hypothetical protein ASPZODRAFT_169878 [Penicilliopsis zonata CBS 506.65]
MAGLSEASAVFATIQMAQVVIEYSAKYISNVKDAKKSMEKLQTEVKSLTTVLEGLEKQLKSAEDDRSLRVTRELKDAIDRCSSHISSLQTDLQHWQGEKSWTQRIKWPLRRSRVEDAVEYVDQCKKTIILALQVDQTALIVETKREIESIKLPIEARAIFDSFSDRGDECLPDTRTDLRRQVVQWAEDPSSKSIFWLNGMAGTGKSTIARTLARHFQEKGQLGASFFFKRGEGAQGDASRFITTIAQQLLYRIPKLASEVRQALLADTLLPEKNIAEQFQMFILGPLKALSMSTQLVVLVIDALDECEPRRDVQLILKLLSSTPEVTTVRLRIFITSRPDMPIPSAFKRMSDSTYQNLLLHQISEDIIRHDIEVFLTHRLAEIRHEHCLLPEWPGPEKKQALLDMVLPLFICAATVCRFIADPRWNPERRLQEILQYKLIAQISQLDITYRPVLDHLLADLSKKERSLFLNEFHQVVGSIIVFYEPLSVASLSALLDIPEHDISCRINDLHSVLEIPSDNTRPIRPLHLSFHDFLVDPDKQDDYPFWVNERERHADLTHACLRLLSKKGVLRKNICNLPSPGTERTAISPQTIQESLSVEVQYACRYWIRHLKESGAHICDGDLVHSFLSTSFLHWLECLNLMGGMSRSVSLMETLQLMCSPEKGTEVSQLLCDAQRFVMRNRVIVDAYPLQLYSSALSFVPQMSLVRQLFEGQMLKPSPQLSNPISSWDAKLESFDISPNGHTAVSPNRQLIAISGHVGLELINLITGTRLSLSVSRPSFIRFSDDSHWLLAVFRDQESSRVEIFDTQSGLLEQIIQNPHAGTQLWWQGFQASLSPDNKLVTITAPEDSAITILDRQSSGLLQTLKVNRSHFAFSPDSRALVFVSSENQVVIQDLVPPYYDKKTIISTLDRGFTSRNLAIFPDGNRIALSVQNRFGCLIQVWNRWTGSLEHTLDGHCIINPSFFPDGRLIVQKSDELKVSLEDEGPFLWEPITGTLKQLIPEQCKQISFTADERYILTLNPVGTAKLWDFKTQTVCCSWYSHGDKIDRAFIRGDEKALILIYNYKIEIWDLWADETILSLSSSSLSELGSVCSVNISPTSNLICAVHIGQQVSIWKADGIPQKTWDLPGNDFDRFKVLFSLDGTLLALQFTGHIEIRNTASGNLVCRIQIPLGSLMMAFSPKNTAILSCNKSEMLSAWSLPTGTLEKTWKAPLAMCSSLSPDGGLLAAGSLDGSIVIKDGHTDHTLQTIEASGVRKFLLSEDARLVASVGRFRVNIWNIQTGELVRTAYLPGLSEEDRVCSYGQYLASFAEDGTIRVWNLETRAIHSAWKAYPAFVYPSQTIALCPDGRCLISSGRNYQSENYRVHLLDPSSGSIQPLAEESLANSIEFSQNGEMMASSLGCTIELWSLQDARLLKTLSGHDALVDDLVFSPDGRRLVSKSVNGTVNLWDLDAMTAWEVPNDVWIKAVAFSHDSRLLSLHLHQDQVKIWDIEAKACLATIYQEDVTDISFSPDDRYLLILQILRDANSTTGSLWDLKESQLYSWSESRKIRRSLFAPDGRLCMLYINGGFSLHQAISWQVDIQCDCDPVAIAAWSPDGKWLITETTYEEIIVWETETYTIRSSLPGHVLAGRKFCFESPDRLLVSEYRNSSIKRWCFLSGDLEGFSQQDTSDKVMPLPDSRIAIASLEKFTRNGDEYETILWDLDTGKRMATLNDHRLFSLGERFSADGRVIVSSRDDKTLQLWNPHTGALQLLLQSVEDIYLVAISENRRLVATGHKSNVKLWDSESKYTQIGQFSISGDLTMSLTFSPDSKFLVAGDKKKVQIWRLDVRKKQPLQMWRTIEIENCYNATFSPDGKLLIFGKVTQSWDPVTDERRILLSGHTRKVTAITFSHDGSRLASASKDHTINIWDVPTGRHQMTLEVRMDIRQMRFSQDDSYLITDAGTFALPATAPDAFSFYPHPEPGPCLWIEDEWVVRGAEKILYLPTEYRPTDLDYNDGLLVWGTENHGLVFMRDDFPTN